jgi:methyl-accepting chemotaxis protein
MNPDQNRSGTSVNALGWWGAFVSIAITFLMFVLLAFLNLNLNGNSFLLAVAGCAVLVLVGILSVNYVVQRKIRERYQELIDVCRDYLGGDRSARASVIGDDEFATLSSTLNTVLDNQGPAVAGASLENSTSDAAALQAQIEKLLQEVSAVGDGDLRVQAEVTPDTLGVLADSFNYMIEELAKVVGRVQATAVQVSNETRRILDRSAEQAQASETQVSQIAKTTEAVEALAVFIQNVARNAQLSVEAAQEALRNAANGQQSVSQTIQGMMQIRENVQETSKKIKRLGERSNEIGEIVRIIEDIADQTNLLALNAAIQSAMAGEHGRGFAVVADEIRLLAERSTESTKRIATLVKSIQGDTYEAVVAMEDSTQEVVKGSQLADEAGRSLNSIYQAVERQAKMIEDIALAANEQASVSESVAIAMGRISELTRQSDAGTQEAAVSVSYLAELSEQLRASVSTFRLPERSNEMIGSFGNAPAIPELAESNNGGQMFAPSSADSWGQPFPGNFPPLPEPSNSGSLLSMTSGRDGQFAFDNNLQNSNLSGFGSQPTFSSPLNLNGGGMQSFQNQPTAGSERLPQFGGSGDLGFGGQAQFGKLPDFGVGGGQPSFGNLPDFGDLDALDNQQQNINNGNWFAGQQFGAAPAAGNGNQQAAPSPNPGLLPSPPQTGQPSPRQPRWAAGGFQQNQSPFGQEQRPFRDNA